MARKKKKKPELKIVFDTNALYTKSASDLVSQAINEIIKTNSNHSDISFQWFLSDIVVMERKFQMHKKGLELLPAIQKMEKLLCHNLNITDDILKSRIDIAINKSIKELNLIELQTDTEKIDWPMIIHKSLFRELPFEDSENEKGFRDSLIAECFYQLVDDSPKTSKVCRIVFVTIDKNLANAIENNTKEMLNVRVIRNLEELTGYINTLVSEVDEEFINSIKNKAANYFFAVNNQNHLFAKEKIEEKINEKFSDKLEEYPLSSSSRENGIWYIGKPNFVKKIGQRIHWLNKIKIESKAFKINYSLSPNVISGLLGLTQNQTTMNTGQINLIPKVSNTTKELVSEGETMFEVVWSIAVSTSQKFSHPKIESLNYIETVWNNV